MIECLVKSKETYFPETHDSRYNLEDDWVTPTSLPKSKFRKNVCWEYECKEFIWEAWDYSHWRLHHV